MELEIVCSWCERSMGSKDCEVPDHEEIPHPITHGICPDCFEKAKGEINAMTINKANE